VREAREQNEEAEVDPTPYLYPGPKPQTREAGIMMLADGIEAAARTIEDPEVDRIQGMVQKIINKVFSSGQLEDSQLTLRDLHLIAKAFIRILAGIHHHRIAYSKGERGSEPPRRLRET
jgi:membrane-associated HD superfamily phosphohydrolase